MDPSSALGSVVILKNIVAKPEFNSRYATVEEYDGDRKRYLLRLIDHINIAPSMSAWVTEEKFTIIHPRIFPHYSNLPKLIDEDDNKLLARYHTQQDSIDNPIHTSILGLIDGTDTALNVNEKGIILGAHGGSIDENGLYLPMTKLRTSFDIQLDNDTDTLEIEDIYFHAGKEAGGLKYCLLVQSGNIIFRRCRFEGDGVYEVYVKGVNASSLPHVVFENCVFKAGCYCDRGNARFLNCFFRDSPHTSVSVVNESSVNVEYCDIRGAVTGVWSEGKQCKVSHTSMRNVENGVHSKKGLFSVIDCVVLKATTNGAIFSNSTCVMKRCKVEDCGFGVYIATTGSVSIIDSVISICKYGLHVGFDCVGIVNVSRSSISGSGENIAHGGQAKCVVKVDGKIFPKNGRMTPDYYSPSLMANYIAVNLENEHLIRRSLKNAGKSEFGPFCGHCEAQEPADAKFKKCSRCNKVPYCSPECQKAAWKTHKKACADASK